MGAGQGSAVTTGLRRVVWLVALLNLAYFGVEFAVAVAIRSVSLFADSIDFLEDASINLLILAALGWTAPHRARVGMVLAGILLVPSLATLWTVCNSSPRRCCPSPCHSHWPARVRLPSTSRARPCWPATAGIRGA